MFEVSAEEEESLRNRISYVPDASAQRKPGRNLFNQYFYGPPLPSEVALVETLHVRTIKPNAVNTVEKRVDRLRGKVYLGGGRLYCELKHGRGFSVHRVKWTFDLGMIKEIIYETEEKRDFTLTFHHTENELNILFSTCKKAKQWLLGIFAEVRVRAVAFNKILKSVATEPWLKVLRVDMIDGLVTSKMFKNSRSPKKKLSKNERNELIMDEESMFIIETCIREEIDLWTLCRGPDHPDVAEACERLALWLQTNKRKDEAYYWWQQVKECKKNWTIWMRKEIDPTLNPGRTSEYIALHNLRNPPGMQVMDQVVEQRKQNANVNYDARQNRLLQAMRNIARGVPIDKMDGSSPVDDLI